MMDLLRKLLHRSQAPLRMYPDPRLETPAQAAHRLAHLERSADALARKIEKVYSDPFDIADDERDWSTHTGQFHAHYWLQQHGNDAWLGGDAKLQQGIAEGIERATSDYLKVFCLYKRLATKPTVNEAYNSNGRAYSPAYLFEIYANHITNAAEARFIAAGVDALQAHRINGYVIRNTVDLAEEVIRRDCYIAPAQSRPKTQLQAIEQVDQLRNHWRLRSKQLHEAFYKIERQGR